MNPRPPAPGARDDGWRRFLEDHVRTYDELQALLLVAREPERTWSAEEVAAEIHVSRVRALVALAHLTQHGFNALAAKTSRFRYSPRDPAWAPIVERIDEVYRGRPVVVARVVSSNAVSRMRAAAMRAFRGTHTGHR